MGAGKTTIGKRVSQYFHCDFYDSDKMIEERTGVSIPLIFELEGEAGFRKRETDVLIDLMQMKNLVLATGGGSVLKEENRILLKEDSLIIFLNANLEQLYHRTAHDKNRPLLQSDDPKEKLRSILEERLPIYTELADIIIETDHQSINVAVNAIIKKIQESRSF